MKTKIPKSKRFRVAVGALVVNFFIFTFGMYKGVDLSDLGIGLAALNSPIYVYIFGESSRPSEK